MDRANAEQNERNIIILRPWTFHQVAFHFQHIVMTFCCFFVNGRTKLAQTIIKLFRLELYRLLPH